MAALTDINGVGPSRAERLAEAGYGTVGKVADASVDELRAIAGVSIAAAEAIILGARELAPDGATTDSDDDGSPSGDIIDRIAAEIIGDAKARKRMIRAVSREIADRLAKPLRKELGGKGLKVKRIRKA
ncbi:hypothetical protein HOI71_19730, partial [Candidatus Poribacteria bacterium]|nr:hypothetical protein [Candidatus Poribacteria bacterium]